ASSRQRVEDAHRVVEDIVSAGRTVYGVNTGFGKLSDVHIEPSQLSQLQINLVRSHSCGLGPPLSEQETRAMMLLRANVLALGYSGCRPALIDTLLAMLERGVTPVIPEKGSVGASGDLAPLAHLALAMIGEGEAVYRGETSIGAEAFRRAGIEPLQLEGKEGLALLTGPQAMHACSMRTACAACRRCTVPCAALWLTRVRLLKLKPAAPLTIRSCSLRREKYCPAATFTVRHWPLHLIMPPWR